MSKRRKRLLLLLSVLVAGTLALELAARIYAKSTMQVRGQGFHPELGWKPLPNVEKRGSFWGREVPAVTNSHGWRDAEHGYEKGEGTKRIVALGDSFTFGVDVDYGERFSEYLEEEVEGLEVVNLGVNAYGTAHELRALEVEGLKYEPDIVLLVAFLGNDLDDIRNMKKATWPCPWYRFEGGELTLIRPELEWDIWLRTKSYLAEKVIDVLDTRQKRTYRAPPWETRDTVPLFGALVNRMRERAEEQGAKFLCVLTYPKERLGHAPVEREVRARNRVEHHGVAVLDTLDLFSKHADRDLYGGRHEHWTPDGHRILADSIRAELVRRGWL